MQAGHCSAPRTRPWRCRFSWPPSPDPTSATSAASSSSTAWTMCCSACGTPTARTGSRARQPNTWTTGPPPNGLAAEVLRPRPGRAPLRPHGGRGGRGPLGGEPARPGLRRHPVPAHQHLRRPEAAGPAVRDGPGGRLAELQRQRDGIDAEMQRIRDGNVRVMTGPGSAGPLPAAHGAGQGPALRFP